MEKHDFTMSIMADASPEEAFNCINNVTAWWTENLEGSSQRAGDEFTVWFGDVHRSTQQLTEFVPGKKVVWLITESRLSFIKDQKEWTGTKVSFEVRPSDGKTEVKFTHIGLEPSVECSSDCSDAWGHYIKGSLLPLIATGKGNPEPKEKSSME